jgi:hypothetical protein
VKNIKSFFLLFNNICIVYYKEIFNTKKNFVINNTNIIEQIKKKIQISFPVESASMERLRRGNIGNSEIEKLCVGWVDGEVVKVKRS